MSVPSKSHERHGSFGPSNRTAIYCRADPESEDAEIAGLTAYARAAGWEITEIFTDPTPESGPDQIGLEALMGAVTAGRIDRVVVPAVSCLSELLGGLVSVTKILRAHSVALVSVDGSLDTTTVRANFFLQMLDTFGECEGGEEGRWSHP